MTDSPSELEERTAARDIKQVQAWRQKFHDELCGCRINHNPDEDGLLDSLEACPIGRYMLGYEKSVLALGGQLSPEEWGQQFRSGALVRPYLVRPGDYRQRLDEICYETGVLVHQPLHPASLHNALVAIGALIEQEKEAALRGVLAATDMHFRPYIDLSVIPPRLPVTDSPSELRLQADDWLYPQMQPYNKVAKSVLEWLPELAEQARKHMAEKHELPPGIIPDETPMGLDAPAPIGLVHPDVWARWELIAEIGEEQDVMIRAQRAHKARLIFVEDWDQLSADLRREQEYDEQEELKKHQANRRPNSDLPGLTR